MLISTIIEDAIIRKDGSNELVGIATFTLPDVEHKAETVTGLGVIEHDVTVPTAFSSMTLSLKFINRCKDIMLGPGNVNLTATAAILLTDTESHNREQQKIVCSFKGTVKKTGGGEFGKATKNETEVEIALTYFKEELNGEIVHEIDVYNRTAIVNGIDLYGKLKSILA
ncbi:MULTISPECIES: phage major tail tube protein [Fusobacterium]|uniref:Phage tail tube protein FII n=2 Tax=Fusobacterium TaxID=848 RepID=A0AAN3VUB2_9FUSO|nr:MULTISPECIES: phage major tail tube protein [Fusobacterium]EJU15564.1 phage tail tube protein FII [Fusobacterium necrophorum subsp. funduliforme Fnf 1007]KXA14549.1 putative phage major tail tube protein [Fusobacterium equinum]MDK4477477.1 phage major tail tube protein [Fusobacterium necrophorum]MDK4486102.1 phage major tail tube protein [Fusobacterium necrophorum]